MAVKTASRRPTPISPRSGSATSPKITRAPFSVVTPIARPTAVQEACRAALSAKATANATAPRGGYMPISSSSSQPILTDHIDPRSTISTKSMRQPASLPYTLTCCQGRAARLGSADHKDRPDNQTRTAMGEQRLWEKSYPAGVRWDAPVKTASLPSMFDDFTAEWGP